MTDEELIAELERQREPASRWIAYYDAVEKGVVGPAKPQSDSSEMTGPIVAALSAHPLFSRGRNVFFAYNQLNLHPWYVSAAILRVMLRSDAASAVAWLHRLFKTDRAELRMVAAVHGVDVQDVQQPVKLSNGVRLLPLAAAPISTNLRRLARQYSVIPMDISLAFVPTIAVLDMGTVTASTGGDAAVNDTAYDSILDAARAFTLTEHGSPVVGISWTDFVAPELAAAELGMWMSPRFEGGLSQFSPVKINDEALAWADRYLQMKDPIRRKVAVALDRLNLARRRRSTGDRAIDSGICLEALLTNDNKELTYKLRLRAALLLGRTIEERQKISMDVRDLYKLRSSMVHGDARGAKEASGDAQTVTRGLELCMQAVRAIVRRNALPDFARWELTGGPCDPEDG